MREITFQVPSWLRAPAVDTSGGPGVSGVQPPGRDPAGVEPGPSAPAGPAPPTLPGIPAHPSNDSDVPVRGHSLRLPDGEAVSPDDCGLVQGCPGASPVRAGHDGAPAVDALGSVSTADATHPGGPGPGIPNVEVGR